MWRSMVGTLAAVAAIVVLLVPMGLAQSIDVVAAADLPFFAGPILTYQDRIFTGWGMFFRKNKGRRHLGVTSHSLFLFPSTPGSHRSKQ